MQLPEFNLPKQDLKKQNGIGDEQAERDFLIDTDAKI